MPEQDPHAGQPVVAAGRPLGQSAVVVLMIHGRGAGPENILSLVRQLDRPDLTYLAPAAANRTWYPNSFLADLSTNEPWLTSALGAVAAVVERVEQAGVPRSRIVLLGFSQGACLGSEFAVRQGTRLGGVVAFSGGAIGPPGTAWPSSGQMAGTPVFLGCSDRDQHVPESRVNETAGVFERLGARVTTRIYPGMGHVINDDEIRFAQRLVDSVSE
jgi:predicted esterase